MSSIHSSPDRHCDWYNEDQENIPFHWKKYKKKLDMTKNSFHLWVADFCTCSRHLYNHLRIPSKVKFEHNRQRQSCLNLTIVTIEHNRQRQSCLNLTIVTIQHNRQRQSCLNLTWRSPSCWRAAPSRPPWPPRRSTFWLLLQNPFLLSWSQNYSFLASYFLVVKGGKVSRCIGRPRVGQCHQVLLANPNTASRPN